MEWQRNFDFGDIAPDFDRLFKDVWELTRLEASSLDHIFEGRGIRNVLDCAAGTGIQSLGLAELGYNVFASDISVEMLERLKEKASDRRLKIDVKRADFRTLQPWKGSSFDAVICCGNSIPLLAGIDEVKSTVRAMLSVTKRPHGVGVIGLHNYVGPGDKKNRWFFRGSSLDTAGLELSLDIRFYDQTRVRVNYLFMRLGKKPRFRRYVKSYLLLDPRILRELMADCGYKDVKILDRRGFAGGFDEFPLVVGET